MTGIRNTPRLSRLIVFKFFLMLLVLEPDGLIAGIITVPTDYSTIQAAVDAAQNGDEIVISPGTYTEIIRYPNAPNNKDFVLRSQKPYNYAIVKSTIIVGSIYLNRELTAASRIDGLTIRGSGPGISGHTNSPRPMLSILRCRIVENYTQNGQPNYGMGLNGINGEIAYNEIMFNTIGNLTLSYILSYGAGLYACDGWIHHNVISNNRIPISTVNYGGGLSNCDGLIEYNIISENHLFAGEGSGLHDCDGIIQFNLITKNGENLNSSVIARCDGIIRNNIISKNTSHNVALIYNSSATFDNNVIWGNTGFSNIFAWFNGQFNNGIVWGNTINSTLLINTQTNIFYYSTIQDWLGGGTGIISSDPLLTNPAQDKYTLSAGSPCIDAGNPESEWNDACLPPGLGEARNDMGAFGGPFNCESIHTPPTPFPTPTPVPTPPPLPSPGPPIIYTFDASDDGWTSGGAAPIFDLTAMGRTNSALSISPDHFFTFGFLLSPSGDLDASIYPAPGGRLTNMFDVRVKLKWDGVPCKSPHLRIRSLSDDFSQSDVLGIVSAGDCSLAPGSEDQEYSFQIIPRTANMTFRVAVDMLNFDPFTDPDGSVYLDQIVITPRVFHRYLLGLTARWDFTISTDGWTTGTATGLIAPEFSQDKGAIVMTSQSNTLGFGFWQSPPVAIDSIPPPFAVYMNANVVVDDSFDIQRPAVRIRMFTNDQQIYRYTELEASPLIEADTQDAEINATALIKAETLWHIPKLPSSTNDIRVAFDLISFNPLAPETFTVSLDNLLLYIMDDDYVFPTP